MLVKFESERLLLRTLEKEDLDYAMDFWGNEEVMKYCLRAINREEILRTIEAYRNLQNGKGFSVYAVVLKENNEVIGVSGFNPTENENEIELIYHFAKKYWGKGYASEAARACIDYAKNNINADKIVASVDPQHNSSRKILEKSGFEFKYMKWYEETKQEEPYFELSML